MREKDFEEITINITYSGKFVGSQDQQKDILVLNSDQTLDQAFKNYVVQKNLKIEGEYYFYIIENNQILKELQKDSIVSELGLNSNVNIFITDKYLEIKNKNNPNDYVTLQLNQNNPKKKHRTLKNALKEKKYYSIKNTAYPQIYKATSTETHFKEKENKIKEKVEIKKKTSLNIVLIIISIIAGLAAFTLGTVYIIKYYKNKKSDYNELGEPEKTYTEEKLIANIQYKPDLLLRYLNKKSTILTVEGGEINTSQNENKNGLSQLIDFFFLIRQKNVENDNETLIKKNWYTGYLCILNMTLKNKTNDMMVIYDEKMYKLIGNSSLKKLTKNDLKFLDENGKLCFVKFEFYESGNIKNIYLPEKFNANNTGLIEEILKLIIPKISPDLYQKNINETLKKIFQGEDEENDDIYENGTIFENETLDENEIIDENEDEDILMNGTINDPLNDNEKENEIKLRRRVYSVRNNPLSYKNSSLLRKLLNENKSSLFDNDTIFNDASEMIIEEYLTPPSESLKYDLREANNYVNDSDLNQANSCTNLTQYSVENIECDEAKMENSLLNTSVYSKINENGILEYITEIKSGIISNQIDLDDDQISSKNLNETNNEDNDNRKDNFFNISSLSLNSITHIELINHFSNETINQQLYEYFDNFTYKIYNDENKTNEKNLRYLKEKEKFMKLNNLTEINESTEYFNEQKQRKRKLDDSSSYYGMKNINYEKNSYNYNLIGLKMQSKIFNEIDPSTGTSSTYFLASFGNRNTEYKVRNEQTNLHKILENKNQMAFSLINLLYQSYLNLNERNKKYADVIIEIEKNVSRFLESSYDFSDLFRDSVNEMYNQVKNFTGEFFIELIHLINNVYDNYNLILDNVKSEKYDTFNQIRNVTKYEYIKYIINMINILEIFYNKTILFLDDLEKELAYVNNFQIDILYDIIDSLNDGKLIIKQFNKKLFKSIEKDILTFKYDIQDYVDKIIGDLLYIVDFLSININKNEILIQAIDEKTRNDVSKKLKNCRNIITTIFDLLISNINKDFDNEMSITNENSIKFISEQKAKSFLDNIEKNSDDMIDQIKLKIKYINLYELYSDNIDNINNIQNKTFIEFINDMYNNLLLNISTLYPEYLDKNSRISQIKQKIKSVSKNLTNNLNEEIREINEYIINYTEKYKEENIYNMYYSLYHFKKAFDDKEMENLLNKFDTLLIYTFKYHFKTMILYNFYLAYQVFNEEYQLFRKIGGMRRYIGSGFYKRYFEYKSKFEEYLALTYSEEFLNLLEKYFYKIRDDIINNVIDRMSKINKYYFNNEKNANNFFFLDQINKEIHTIIDNINNYYNEINLDTKIKIKVISLSNEILSPYHKNKINRLDNYYNKIYSKTDKEHIKNTDSDYVKSYLRWFRWKKVYYYCPHSGNINLILNDLTKTDEYLLKGANIIINDFIKKFDNYLNNYIILNQKLYNNLFIYVNEKTNNNKNIESFLLNYDTLYKEILNKDSNYALYQKLSSNDFNVSVFMKTLENNVNLLKDNYFNIYYLKNYSDFLEYPGEIVYKINQFSNELSVITDYLKEKINTVFEKKISNIIISTNLFIKDFNSFNLGYILTHINTNSIYEEYISSKTKLINEKFINFTHQLNNKYSEYNNKEKNNIFNKENYNKLSEKIINNYKDFVSYFENVITQNFTVKNCSKILISNNSYINENNESIENNTYGKKCESKIKQSELNYSKYNFNIVKLRTGIYYTKNLIENLENVFDQIKYDNIININQINEKDELFNDKNILNFYNDTLNKLKVINKDSLSFIDEPYEYFIEGFKKKFTYEQDYLPFIEKFKKIISLKDEYFNNNISESINKTQDNINFLLNDFNNSLYKQLNYAKNFTYYNFNKKNFEKAYKDYNNLITDSFYEYRQNINFLNKRSLFNISMMKILENLQIKKRNYYKKIINEFAKNYDFELLNISYNLGEKCISYMKKIYDDYKFNYKYIYVELIENYINNYIKYIHSIINDLEKHTKNKLKIIYEKFYESFDNNSTHFVNYQYIENLKINYTNCLNYSYDLLNETIKRDLINYQKFKNYTDLINFINTNCSNNYEDILYNYSEINTIIGTDRKNYTNKIPNECLLNISKIPVIKYFNETENLLNCYNNNYYNSSAIFFDDFNEVDKIKMNDLIKNITSIIKNNYINEEFLYQYLQNYELPDYNNISVNDLYNDFIYIKNTINYVNYIKEDEYKNFLYNSLIISFNNSYYNFVNNYIIDEILDNITILINNKLEFHTIYLQNKIIDEYNYYLFILNKTDEIGYSSKNSFISLYEKFKIKLNESLFYLIEKDIYFYLTTFYRENKNIFMNNFYNSYVNKNDDLSIFKLSDYLEEIIFDKNLNNSLIEISSDLLNKNIIEKIKNKLNTLIEEKINRLFNISDTTEKNIAEILNNKTTIELNENMNNISKKLKNYNEYVNNFSSKFGFTMGNITYNLLYVFIKGVLEPPLLLIKNQYNTIEKKLLEEIFKIVDTFPDFLEIIKNKTNCNDYLMDIHNYKSTINNSFIEYIDALENDLNSYLNKLIHFIYINGLNTYGKPCNESYCMINFNDTFTRRLDNKNYNKKKKIIFNNFDKYIKKSKIDFKRKLSSYDSTMDEITKEVVISFLPYIKDALNNFNSSYLSTDYKNIKRLLKNYIINTNNTYLYNLKKSISMVAVKFSTILTKENYQKMQNKIYKQYNDIEQYINNSTNFINFYVNNFINSLNGTSLILYLLYGLTCNNTIEYYNRFSYLIKNNLKYISENELKQYNIRLMESKEKEKYDINRYLKKDKIRNIDDSKSKEESFNSNGFKENKKTAENIFSKIYVCNSDFTISDTLDKIFSNSKNEEESDDNPMDFSASTEISMELEDFKKIKGINIGNDFCLNFGVSDVITIGLDNSYLAIKIKPEFVFGFCVSVGAEINWDKGEYNRFIDKNGKEVSKLGVEFGFYLPTSISLLQTSINGGIEGNLCSVKFGVKTSISLKNSKKTVDRYFLIETNELSCYLRMSIEFHCLFFSFSFHFYIYKKVLFGLKIEWHNKEVNGEVQKSLNIEGVSNWGKEKEKIPIIK